MMNRANEILNNWTPETASLIATLKRHKFEIVKGNNGEESFKFDGDMKKFIANLIACDEAHLFVRRPGSAKTRWLFLVLGNSPGEIVSDFSIPSEVNANDDALDNATSEHYNRWENRKQPTWTAAEAYPDIYGRIPSIPGSLMVEETPVGFYGRTTLDGVEYRTKEFSTRDEVSAACRQGNMWKGGAK